VPIVWKKKRKGAKQENLTKHCAASARKKGRGPGAITKISVGLLNAVWRESNLMNGFEFGYWVSKDNFEGEGVSGWVHIAG